MGMKQRELSGQAMDLIAGRFRLLAEPMRLIIINTLGEEELSVGHLVSAIGAGQANVSKHLGMLLEAGVVARRKEGLYVFYRVADRTVFELCEAVCSSLNHHLVSQELAIKRFVRR